MKAFVGAALGAVEALLDCQDVQTARENQDVQAPRENRKMVT